MVKKVKKKLIILLLTALYPATPPLLWGQQEGKKEDNQSLLVGASEVLEALQWLKKQQGYSFQRTIACVKKNPINKWNLLQAHFYCSLTTEQRACYTGAINGDNPSRKDLKGDYKKTYEHCSREQGIVYGIAYDKPFASLDAKYGIVFRAIIYQGRLFPYSEQKRILNDFYGSPVIELDTSSCNQAVVQKEELKSAPASPKKPAAVTKAPLVNPKEPVPEQNPALKVKEPPLAEKAIEAKVQKSYPKGCQIKGSMVNVRPEPSTARPPVAVMNNATPVTVTGAAIPSLRNEPYRWYPVSLRYYGSERGGYIAVRLVSCPN